MCKITLGVCKSCTSTHIMQEIALFSRKIYIVCKNFTRPPVVTVATNLNSGGRGVCFLGDSSLIGLIVLAGQKTTKGTFLSA